MDPLRLAYFHNGRNERFNYFADNVIKPILA